MWVDQMHLKLPILFLTAIIGVSVVSGLVLGVSFLKERWEPRIESIDNSPVDLDRTEFRFGGGGYPNERCEYNYLVYTSWSAYNFEVVVESFSEELLVLDGDKRVEAVSHVLQEGKLPDERCIWLSFTVVMPNQTGNYELDLCIKLFGLFFSREYRWMYTFRVESFIFKPPTEADLIVTLNKEIYLRGETMNITIKNISNETVWFTDTACNLFFERFNGVDWEFHTAIIGGLMMAPLEPGETADYTWKLGVPLQPFPPGRYRVGTHGVYAQFEVREVGDAELETIVTGFLKTTDVADTLWEDTVRIIEIYDNELGGKVVVVNYTTMNAVHPHFMCEAIEHHTAVITLNEKGRVISAFCIWGSFHGPDKIWDLVNQRWVERK
jgi:hypothetical protein